jgi:peroxiredoxin
MNRRDLARCGLLTIWPGMTGCARPATVPVFDYTPLDGIRRNSQALRGQVVLVNFWATTCGICVTDMPALTALHQRFAGPAFRTLAVAMSYDPPSRVADFAESRRLPFDVVIDNTGSIAAAFGNVRVTPTTALLDATGAIAFQAQGKPAIDSLAHRISSLLAQA